MKFKVIINRWKTHIKKYFLSYNNGFFHIHMLVNSPELMLKNFSNMPFVKHDKKRQIISTENPCLKVNLFYKHFEDGLTLLVTNAYYKKNIIDHMMYDEELPVEHYFISIKISDRKIQSSYQLVNGTTFSTNIWSICKPKAIKEVCHFKDSIEQYFIVYFTKNWFEKYALNCNDVTKDFLKNFIESPNTFAMWPELSTLNESYKNFFYESLNTDYAEVKSKTYYDFTLKLFDDFASSMTQKTHLTTHYNMSNEQRLKILMVEGILAEYYMSSFPGIEFLSKKVGISAAGLKTGFLNLFGCSLFKYYRIQKMKIASSILENEPNMKIKDLAILLGYQNAAKFSSAFKEEIGKSPSEVINLQI